jgi:uncharacterized protein (TIGR01777 family)
MILIAGGTGLIGSRLTELLRAHGHTVRILSRSPEGEGAFVWDPAKGTYDAAAFEGVQYLINLAGAGIADKRWTTERKKLIRDSRVDAANTLLKALTETGARPYAYIGASAIGFYGDTGDQWNHENDEAGTTGFMPPVCVDWEKSHQPISSLGIRTVTLRIGVVLAKEGGALAEIAKPVRFGVGAYFADGQAWYSWIHRDDLCNLILFALDNTNMRGVYNAVSPHPARNIDLVKATAAAMGKSTLPVPAPAFALRLLLGEMADVVLNSNRVAAEKILSAGFPFEFPDVDAALRHIFANAPQ